MIIFLSLEGVYTDCSKVGGSCQGLFFLGGGRSPRSKACHCRSLARAAIVARPLLVALVLIYGRHALNLIFHCVFFLLRGEGGNVDRLCRVWLISDCYVTIIAQGNAVVKNFFHQ